MDDEKFLEYAKETISVEISEAQNMLHRLDKSISIACRILLVCKGKVVLSGMGKSGHIGRKIAASLASTGTPSFFMHPAEALHGDLGMIGSEDVVIFISRSGRACELDILIPLLVESCIPIIALTGDVNSPLAHAASCVLDVSVVHEACPMELVPTSSIVNTLMMGDALVMALMRYRGFSIEQFARSHPGGALGAQLLNRVCHVMRKGKQIAKVFLHVSVMDAMFELSRTGLGLTAVCDIYNRVVGVFTDGDLRRWLIQEKSLHDPIAKAMTQPGYYLFSDLRTATAIESMHHKKITAAPVVDSKGSLVGMVNVHDLHNSIMNNNI